MPVGAQPSQTLNTLHTHLFCLQSLTFSLLLPTPVIFRTHELYTQGLIYLSYTIFLCCCCFLHLSFCCIHSCDTEALKQWPAAKGTGEILRLCPVYNIHLTGGCYFRHPLCFVQFFCSSIVMHVSTFMRSWP